MRSCLDFALFQIQSESAAAATASAASIAALETRIASALDSMRAAFATSQQQQHHEQEQHAKLQQQQQQQQFTKLQLDQQQQFAEQHKQHQTALARTAHRFDEWTTAHEAAELQCAREQQQNMSTLAAKIAENARAIKAMHAATMAANATAATATANADSTSAAAAAASATVIVADAVKAVHASEPFVGVRALTDANAAALAEQQQQLQRQQSELDAQTAAVEQLKIAQVCLSSTQCQSVWMCRKSITAWTTRSSGPDGFTVFHETF